MKKRLALLILLLITHSIVFSQVTMDEFKKQFKNKSISEIKTMLADQNEQLEKLIKLSTLRIKITPGNINPNETTTTQKFSTSPKDIISKAFNKKLDNLYFVPRIVYPNTILGLDFSSSSLMNSVNDYDDYKFPKPTLKLKKVFFKDGKTIDLNQNIAGRDGDLEDELKGTKWIDSVQLEASYYYPEKMSFIKLSTQNPTQLLDGGKINLVKVTANEVDLQLSESLNEQIIKVEGINASGKAVAQSGSSSSNMSSNYSPAFLKAFYEVSANVIAKIEANQYKNADELVKDLYQNMPKEDKDKPEKLMNASYSFRGNITSINIFFKPKGQIAQYTFIVKNKSENIEGFIIAQNKKDLFGLLDENGKWAVEPTFKRLEYYKMNYLLGDVGADGYGSILWLDKENKKLIPFKYRFYRNEPFFNRYYSIENGVNGPKGLVDMKDNKILIEPINENIYSDGDFIVLSTKNEDRKILNKDLKEILSIGKRSFKINGDFIFVDKPYISKEKFADYTILGTTEDIFNGKGQKINKEDYVIETFDFFGIDSLLLVKNKAGKKLFINTKGDVIIDASKYKDVSFFSNGLAAVKNDKGNWGYINNKENLVIPFMYRGAKNFSKFSALVNTEEGYKLIDRNNKTIKKFADGFSSYGVGKDAKELKYNNYDGKIYGSKGEVIKGTSE